MIGSYWVQIDLPIGGRQSRFFMLDAAGKDQIVRSAFKGGWSAYESPLPQLIAKLCVNLKPAFLDVGANTGYYSLLAASLGASHVWSFEPVPEIRQLLHANVRESGLSRHVTLCHQALSDQAGPCTMYLPDAGHGLIETSASLNRDFRDSHDGSIPVMVGTLDDLLRDEPRFLDHQDIFIKIDVESLESKVIMGAKDLVRVCRPIIAIELLPNTDSLFFESFFVHQRYSRFHLKPDGDLPARKDMACLSMTQRDHVLVPDEKLSAFVDVVSGSSAF